MGLFSRIFKSKQQKTVETQLGPFTLVYSKNGNNIWSNSSSELSLSVQGSDSEPASEQLDFLNNIQLEIANLSDRITKRFIDEFNEAEQEIDFRNWNERFKMVGIDVTMIFQGERFWNITFQDMKTPYAHFTLFIEGQKLTDFSIDT